MAPQREWFEKDYYATLGVPQGASEKDITRAYRKLAKQHHPDANPNNAAAEERFKEVSGAYDVLGDADKRKEYDEVRAMVASGAVAGGPGGYSGAGGPGGFGAGPGGSTFTFEDGDLSDLLGGLFGGRPGAGTSGAGQSRRGRGVHHAPQRGANLETDLHLDFLESVHGVTTSVTFTADAVCSVCHGSGAEPPSTPQVCPECQGSGQVAVNQGPFSFEQVCPRCAGRGTIVEHPCTRCRGRGVEVRPRDVKVRIPAGVKDRQRIRVAGRGGAGTNGAPAGDLYVIVHVRPHSVFSRSGAGNLSVHVPITFAEAALGAHVRVPTLADPVTVKVKAGTQSGTTVKVRGKGIVPAKGSAGDLLVTFDVVVPRKLDGTQRKAVEALGEALDESPREAMEA